MAKKAATDNIVCRNRRAGYRFHVVEKIECGMVLSGTEVKSLRQRNASIEEAYARIDDGELFLIGCHISPYEHANRNNHDPVRERRLLLHRSEILKLKRGVAEKGMTIVPVRLYLKGSLFKLEIALAKGKKLHDKRQALKARSAKRDIERGRD